MIHLTLENQGGMLSVEEQIIDATTEEGQAALKEFEEHERQDRTAAEETELSEKYANDPE
jgi:cell division cycle protein 37